MERQAEPEREWLGWTERAYASVPLSPAAVGAAIAGVLVLAFVVSEFALGRHLLLRDAQGSSAALSDARTAVANCLLAVYLPTAYVYLLRGYRGTLDQLRGALDCSDLELADLRARVGHYYPLALGLASLVGFGFMLGMVRATTPPQIDPWAWSALSQEVRWHRVFGLWHGPWVGIVILAVVVESGRFKRLVTHVSPIDVLDLRPLRPFTRQAMLNALLVVVGVGFGLLAMLESGMWDVVLSFWIVSVVAIAISLVLWLLPVHRLIRDAKRSELDWCRDALIQERTKLREGGTERSRIEEMVAWEARIQAVGEWPLDAPGLRRFLLYLLIPLGSWAGGALVERFVDSLLG